jgi:hypothetical protein
VSDNLKNLAELNIRRFVCGGEPDLNVDDCPSVKDVLERGARLLDKACAHDITGEILFQGQDGRMYVGSVEFVVEEADPSYVRQKLMESCTHSNWHKEVMFGMKTGDKICDDCGEIL